MKVIGIANSIDSGACLLIDGVLKAAINEERLNRDKLTRAFPEQSINWILKSQGLKPDEIDVVGLGVWEAISFPDRASGYLSAARMRIEQNPQTRTAIEERIHYSLARDRQQWAQMRAGLERLGFGKHHIIHCAHQLAHACSAFAYSPYEKALVVTLDGRGDFTSGSVSCWKRNLPPEIIRTELEIDSLGMFYGWITHYLEFTPHRHEGKVTGLSAFGVPEKCIKVLEKMIEVRQGCIYANIGDYYAPYMEAELPVLRKQLLEYGREDIAAAAQQLLEQLVISYVRHYLHKTGEKNLCLAGGIFANVLLNMKLRELSEVDNLFVFPHMGDGGVAVGGAVWAARELGDRIRPLENVYLGPCFDSVYCARVVNSNSGLSVIEPGDFSGSLATLLHNGAVVGFYSGAMEYGPRALGARSILVRATDPSINTTLNHRLNRTEFMPFAPVTLEKEAANCYLGWSKNDAPSYYMASCYKSTDLMKRQSPAAIHIDGTARPQIINSDIHREYYNVLKSYHSLSGIPSLINTSFNYHEEPIIYSPQQAMNALKLELIDALAMPPFILFKNTKWKEALKRKLPKDELTTAKPIEVVK